MQKITDQIWWEMPNKIQNSERMQPRKWGTNFGISTNISRTTVREASASRRHIAKSGHHWNSSNTTDNIVPGGFRAAAIQTPLRRETAEGRICTPSLGGNFERGPWWVVRHNQRCLWDHPTRGTHAPQRSAEYSKAQSGNMKQKKI